VRPAIQEIQELQETPENKASAGTLARPESRPELPESSRRHHLDGKLGNSGEKWRAAEVTALLLPQEPRPAPSEVARRASFDSRRGALSSLGPETLAAPNGGILSEVLTGGVGSAPSIPTAAWLPGRRNAYYNTRAQEKFLKNLAASKKVKKTRNSPAILKRARSYAQCISRPAGTRSA
jgi:hypothetical protein